MCARRFLIVVFVLTLLVVAAGFAFHLWGGNVLLSQATPKGRFQSARAGDAPDYGRPGSWISNPRLDPLAARDPAAWLPDGVAENAPAAASVFYVHPTTYFATDRWNAPLDPGAAAAARTALFVRSQATAFTLAGRVWAPRYRQAAYGAFLLNSEDARKALDLAYADVAAAFRAFLAQAPQGPIILAGHSQGALHLERLLREEVAGGPVARRIAAAYVVGWPISTTADLPFLGLPACRDPRQARCILSWMTFGDLARPGLMLDEWEKTRGSTGAERRQREVLCVNPISGIQDGAAPADANPGTLIPNASMTRASLAPGRVGAYCSTGLLTITGDIPSYIPPPLPGNNFHVYDYALFWGAIRRDAANRLAAWNDHQE